MAHSPKFLAQKIWELVRNSMKNSGLLTLLQSAIRLDTVLKILGESSHKQMPWTGQRENEKFSNH